jgi:hypothetical protein
MPVKASLGFYIGGMGSKKRNFHKALMARMGYEAEAEKIQELFFEGKRKEAPVKELRRAGSKRRAG